MAQPDDATTSDDPLGLGQAAASQLGGEWQLDAVDDALFTEEVPPLVEEPEEVPPPVSKSQPSNQGLGLPKTVPVAELPPSLEQLVEAMLFVGGPPLTATVAGSVVRGLTTERFLDAVSVLNKRYRDQNRPYAIESRDDGFVLAVRPAYRNLRERLFAGPREARLSQPALDVLSVVAYRQPVGKAEVDAVRGTDSGAVLRQLVRLGLIAVQHRAEATAREVRYGTTPRFLEVFGLASLDELPRLGDASQV